MIVQKKSLLTEKTLYHGTVIDNIDSIRKYGLLPSVGKFVKDAYESDIIGCDGNPDDYLKELVFATDKQQLDRAVTAITAQIGLKLNKGFHDVTDDEFIKHGMLAIIKDGDFVMERRPDSDDRDWREYPHTVEPGDYYSDDYIGVDIILTGNNMIRVLKRYGVWPRKWILSAAGNISNLKSELIRLAIKYHKDKSKEEIIKMVNSISKKQHLMNKIDAYKQALGEKIVHESKIKLSEIKSLLKELIDEEYKKVFTESMFPKEFNRHNLGVCMDAAKMATIYFLERGIKNFSVIEGFVSMYPEQDELDWSPHTWIQFDNGRIFDPTKKQWKQWGFNPEETKYEKISTKFTPHQYIRICQLQGDLPFPLKKNLKENYIQNLDDRGELWLSKFGQDKRDVRSEHFMIKFGTDVVGKNHGIIFLDGKWFAGTYIIPLEYGQHGGNWVINAHTGAMKSGTDWGTLDKSFKTLEELLEFLENWYKNKFSRINENIQSIDERIKFADLYDDTDDERIAKSKLPGMRVRSLQVSTNNDRDMWRFDYSYVSSEKSEWEQYREKVGHKGHIYFFKENIEPDDNLEDLECMVDCTCRDFKYRWAYALAQDDASIVGPKSLNKSVNAPPVKTNPLGHQQLCKHLSALRRYVVTNIEKALDQAQYRTRPFSLTEEMDKLANKGRFVTVYNSK